MIFITYYNVEIFYIFKIEVNYSNFFLFLYKIFLKIIALSENHHNSRLSDLLPYSHLLTDEQRLVIEQNINIVKFKKKDVIFRQNTRSSHVMFVKSGLVKIFKEARNDRTLILKIAQEGDYVGLMSVLARNYISIQLRPLQIRKFAIWI